MLVYVIVAVVAAVVVGVAIYLICSQKLAVAKAELRAEREKVAALGRQYDETLRKAEDRFRALAQTILDDRSAKLQSEGEKGMKTIAEGLQTCIREFRARVEKINTETTERGTRLEDRITSLVEQTNTVSAQANNLADAIRGEAQLTGEWGEIQLKRVLECAGLAEGVGYTYQETFYDSDSGRKSKRTDFVIALPEERKLIIDSKSTVESAVAYHEAKTKEEKAAALASIVESVRKHIDEIDEAKYPSVVANSLPVVLMYIPVDEVYMIAMKSESPGTRELLREYAARKNVVMVNSSGVLPVMKLVQMMWEAEKTSRNSGEIIAAGEELLRRCNAFVESFTEMGSAFEAANKSYLDAKNKLVDAPGGQSILKAANSLIKLGAKPQTKSGKPLEISPAILEA